MKTLNELHQRFLDDLLLKNKSRETIRAYGYSWVAFRKHFPNIELDDLNDELGEDIAIAFAKSDLSSGGANAHARALNSFFSWLTKKYTKIKVKIPQQKVEKRVMRTFTDDDMRNFLKYEPTSRSQRIAREIILLCADTGIRVKEALTLERQNVNLEHSVITVLGKGSKERTIPIGPNTKEMLRKRMRLDEFDLVFATRTGKKFEYHNMRRAFLQYLIYAGVDKSEGAFHALRRYFGKNFIGDGGNPLLLKQAFGHTTLDMTMRYVEEDINDLKRAHSKMNHLGKLIKGEKQNDGGELKTSNQD